MGSITNFNLKCPFCGDECLIQEIYYKSYERELFCPNCGYNKFYKYTYDENCDVIKKDKFKNSYPDNLVITEEK